MHEEQKRAYKLTHDVLKSRENLLFNAYKQGYSQVSHCNFSSQWTMPKLEFGNIFIHLFFQSQCVDFLSLKMEILNFSF